MGVPLPGIIQRPCIADAVSGTDAGEADAKLDELMAAVRRFAKVR